MGFCNIAESALRRPAAWGAVRRFAGAVGLVVALAGPAPAQQLPSTQGATVDLARKLAAGQWLDLGAPGADPAWGAARGRTWTSTMPYSASLGGAFLYGEGIHGWVDERTGRYMDDLWLYDVNAHRWVNLHPGTDTRNPPKLIVNEDGFEALADGSPVPIAISVHGYEMVTWDPHRQLMYTVPSWNSYLKKPLPGVLEFRDRNASRLNRDRASPWIFDPWNRKWHRLRTTTASPPTGVGDVLLYVPSKREVFHYHNGAVQFYNPGTNRWRVAGPVGPRPPFGIDPVACYDAKRDRIYVGGGGYPVAKGDNALWIYDVAGNRWIDPRPAGSPGGNHFGTNVAILNCDSAIDRVVLIRHGGQKTGVYVYDPDRNAWADTVVPLPSFWRASLASSGFFHPELGVHYVFSAGDSRDNGRMAVFRAPR